MAQKLRLAYGVTGGALTLLVAYSLAWGQTDRPATAAAPAPTALTQDCQVAGGSVATNSALSNVTAALQQHKQIKILAIGASSAVRRGTWRGGHTEEARQILQDAVRDLDVVLINRGVGGELSAQAVERIQNEVALNRPELVLWQVGTEDALAYVPLEELQTTIIETVRWLKAHNVDVVLVGLQFVDSMEGDENYRKVRELLREVAAKEKVMIVQRYEAQRLLSLRQRGSGLPLLDQFERSEAGYVCLAQYLARAITMGVFGGAAHGREENKMPSRN
jgi:acyl-CoA thioesterase-1